MRLEEKKNPKLTESLVFGHYRQFVSAENVNTQSNLCQKYSSSSPPPGFRVETDSSDTHLQGQCSLYCFTRLSDAEGPSSSQMKELSSETNFSLFKRIFS